MGKETFEWGVVKENFETFDIDLTLHAKSKLMNFIFEQSKNVMLRKRNINILTAKLDEIKEFDVIPQYLKMIESRVGVFMNTIKREMSEEGYLIYRYSIKSAKFKRNDENWDIYINLEGKYKKK